MKVPSAVKQLLDELTVEDSDTGVVTIDKSKAVVYPGTGLPSFTLDANACGLVFNTTSTVSLLWEALDERRDITIELHSVTLEEEVMDFLEQTFARVDEH